MHDKDNLPLWQLVKSSDIRLGELAPILKRNGLPVDKDPDSGEFFTSKAAFASLLRSLGSVGNR